MKKVVSEKNKGTRLDLYIKSLLKNLSRQEIKQQIESEKIFVNKRGAKPSYRVKVGDLIEIFPADEKDEKSFEVKKINLEIIAEKEDYLIINKPPFILVHPTQTSAETTLCDILSDKFPQIKKIGSSKIRPAIVHRLDKDVSGVMVVPKNEKTFISLKNQFQKREVLKEYTALVHGNVSLDHAIIATPIGRSKNGRKMAAHPNSKDKDKSAITEYFVIERIKGRFTLLKIKPHTGRTNQIRVHLNSIGHPIVGDELYKNKKIKKEYLERPFLHASKIGFQNCDGDYVEYSCPLEKDLSDFLQTIKQI